MQDVFEPTANFLGEVFDKNALILENNKVANKLQRMNNIKIAESGVATLGAIAGVVYSVKTGGGFWRGVGYFILGGLVIGTATRIITTPFKNKILKEK